MTKKPKSKRKSSPGLQKVKTAAKLTAGVTLLASPKILIAGAAVAVAPKAALAFGVYKAATFAAPLVVGSVIARAANRNAPRVPTTPMAMPSALPPPKAAASMGSKLLRFIPGVRQAAAAAEVMRLMTSGAKVARNGATAEGGKATLKAAGGQKGPEQLFPHLKKDGTMTYGTREQVAAWSRS
jgi:hypothetical protein